VHPIEGDREEQLAGDMSHFMETVGAIRQSREKKDKPE
jgi:hypothetical protein